MADRLDWADLDRIEARMRAERKVRAVDLLALIAEVRDAWAIVDQDRGVGRGPRRGE